MAKHTYFTAGRVYARVYGATDAFEWPGLVDSISIGIQENVINLPDRTTPAGGNYDQQRRIEQVTLTLNHREFYPDTLARALFGSKSNVPGTTVNGEQHVASPGKFILLENPGPYTNVQVTDGDPSDPQPIDPENYEIRGAGIWFHEDAPDVTPEMPVAVTYTHPDYARVQALTGTAPELTIVFEGINGARGDKPVPFKFHRVRLGAAATLELISGDDFGALELTGEVLKDESVSGQGLSQYFYGDIVTPSDES